MLLNNSVYRCSSCQFNGWMRKFCFDLALVNDKAKKESKNYQMGINCTILIKIQLYHCWWHFEVNISFLVFSWLWKVHTASPTVTTDDISSTKGSNLCLNLGRRENFISRSCVTQQTCPIGLLHYTRYC